MSWITVVKKETECQHDYPPLRTVKHVGVGSLYECACGQRFIVSRGFWGYRYYKPVRSYRRPPRTRTP